MKVSAIITEYNPFHNGHLYQINAVKKNSDAIVCIMSGSFVQRGDVAICDKWTRAGMALLNGADLVLELPVCYSVNSAERFAYGSIRTLDSLGTIDELCFGSESGELHTLSNAAHILLEEPLHISEKIKYYMRSGFSYPAARQKAFEGLIRADLLSEPNNILALEYICALIKQNSSIKPATIKRYKTGYHETAAHDCIASATGIRSLTTQGKPVSAYMPKTAFELLSCAGLYNIEQLSSALLLKIRTYGTDYVKTINDVSEGLENRIYAACNTYSSFSAIADAVKTKRYTLAKIRRILISILLGITKELAQKPPEYIRVLGMTMTGANILSQRKNTLPVITKPADFKIPSPLFELDMLASDIAAMCGPDLSKHNFHIDLTTSPIIIK